MLKCQQDSYIKQYFTRLLECVEDDFMVTVAAGTQKKIKAVGIVLQDTILFPEGGGQPCDHGTLSLECADKMQLLSVNYVLRREGKVYHLVDDLNCDLTNVRPGTIVHQSLNWDRRHYHMLQHSGQHLISALLVNNFNVNTISWFLGLQCSFVELDIEDLDTHTIELLETKANSAIREQVQVSVTVYNENDPELKTVKTRGLPEELTGDIRVIHIEGIDQNFCCGTHVSSLKELEMIKILNKVTKPSKGKLTTLLYFVVGEKQVFNMFNKMQHREELISFVLCKPPPKHVELIQKMILSINMGYKKVKSLQEEIVMAEITTFKSKIPLPDFFSLHRPDGDFSLLNFAARQFKDMDTIILFLTAGQKEGYFLLVGNEEFVETVGPKICTAMQGKGEAVGNRFLAKVKKMANRSDVEFLLMNGFYLALELLADNSDQVDPLSTSNTTATSSEEE